VVSVVSREVQEDVVVSVVSREVQEDAVMSVVFDLTPWCWW
jgi:hypothetical protein